MAYIPVPNTVAVDIHYDKDTARCQTRLNYLFSHAVTQGDLDAVVATVVNMKAGYFRPWMPSDCYLRNVTATDLTTASGAQAVGTFPTPTDGNLGGVACPSNVAMVVTSRTSQRGRSFRGRNYLPGGSSVTTTNSAVNALYANNWLAILAAMDSLIGLLGGLPVVVSRFSGGCPVPWPSRHR